MVPLADIFNHKAAIVQLSDDYMIEPICYEGSGNSNASDASYTDNSGSDGPSLGTSSVVCRTGPPCVNPISALPFSSSCGKFSLCFDLFLITVEDCDDIGGCHVADQMKSILMP